MPPSTLIATSMNFHTPFFPLPGAYGVAQIDVEATLDGVADPKTLEAAQGLGRAECLIYFCTVSVA